MEKILIATKNKDKFEIVKKILDTINYGEYEYYNLYDIKNLDKNEKEERKYFRKSFPKSKTNLYQNG